MEASIEKITPEIIEACIDRETAEIDGRPDDEILEGDIWNEVQAFNRCVLSSEHIRLNLLGIATALYDDTAHSSDTYDVVIEHFKALIKSGTLTERQLVILNQACRHFFFLGWHARGAVEEAEQLNKLME